MREHRLVQRLEAEHHVRIVEERAAGDLGDVLEAVPRLLHRSRRRVAAQHALQLVGDHRPGQSGGQYRGRRDRGHADRFRPPGAFLADEEGGGGVVLDELPHLREEVVALVGLLVGRRVVADLLGEPIGLHRQVAQPLVSR